MASRLIQKQRVLLLNSQVIEGYPWLKDILDANEKITDDLIKSLPVEQQNFFDNLLNRVIQQAVSEWEGDKNNLVDDRGNDKSDWINCSLCGQPNRYIFYIQNRLNHVSLNVGSECIRHFGISVDKQGRSTEELIKHAIQLRRLGELNLVFPGIGRIVETLGYRLSEYPMIIPAYLEERYKEVAGKLKQLYYEYLEKKPKDSQKQEDMVDKLSALLSDLGTVQKQIESFVSECSQKKFPPLKQIEEWLVKQGDEKSNTALKIIKEDGAITWKSIYRIWEPGFMDMVLPELRGVFKEIGIMVEKADHARGGYVLALSSREKLRLFCKHEDLLLNYGGVLFGEEPLKPLDVKGILSISVVYDEPSANLVLSKLANQLNKTNITLWGYDYEYNEVVILEKPSGKFIIVELKDFIKRAKDLVLGMDTELITGVEAYVRRPLNRRYSIDDIRFSESNRKQAYIRLK